MTAPSPGERPAAADVIHRNSWTTLYEETNYRELPWFSPRPSPWLVAALRERWIKPGSNVIDVGSGSGSNVLWLGKRGFRATGVDIAPSAVAVAEARAKAARVRVRFQVADALALPFPRRAFTAALDSGCFHSLPIELREGYAHEIARVLAPASPFLLTWVAREERSRTGPSHRPSLAETAAVFEPHFVFAATRYSPPRSRTAWRISGGTLGKYTAYLLRRDGPQPPPR